MGLFMFLAVKYVNGEICIMWIKIREKNLDCLFCVSWDYLLWAAFYLAPRNVLCSIGWEIVKELTQLPDSQPKTCFHL